MLVPPSVRRTALHQPGGTPTVIEVADGSAGAYVASVTVDGSPWTSVSIPHHVVVSASHIVFTLSSEPQCWASDTRPVSASEVHGYRDAPVDLLPVGASPLTDDTGRTVTALAAGESVSFDVDCPAASLYTVTVVTPGSYSWQVSLGETVTAVDGAEFTWTGQTRVFRIIGGGSSFVFTAGTDVALTQLELIAADGA
ncbi:hypothetical protein JN350_02060 [Curtobacterium sp. 24E2]|nr:hypothetical protein JN350_02060 [Curtobacterium sp. 24E2]